MLFNRSEERGDIVQAIINLRDSVYMTESQMTEALQDYGVTWKTLQENKSFVEGVWSGFTWPVEQEATFWRMLGSYREVMVVSMTVTESESAESLNKNLVPALREGF